MPSVLAGREYSGRGMPWQAGAADPPYPGPHLAQFFTPQERAMADAITARIIPSDETGPGAREAGVIDFIEHQLAGVYGEGQRWYMQGPFPEPMETQGYQSQHPPAGLWREGLAALERYCVQNHDQGFAALPPETQDGLAAAIPNPPRLGKPREFADLVMANLHPVKSNKSTDWRCFLHYLVAACLTLAFLELGVFDLIPGLSDRSQELLPEADVIGGFMERIRVIIGQLKI